MSESRTLLDHPGIYGAAGSRAELLRALKEALALVEATAGDARLACAGLRIELVDPGTPRRERRSGA